MCSGGDGASLGNGALCLWGAAVSSYSVPFQTSPCLPGSVSRISTSVVPSPHSGPSQICPDWPEPAQGRAAIHFLSPSLVPFQLFRLHHRGLSWGTRRWAHPLDFLKEAEERSRTCYLLVYLQEGRNPIGQTPITFPLPFTLSPHQSPGAPKPCL